LIQEESMTRRLSARSKTAFGGRRSADFAQLALSAIGRARSAKESDSNGYVRRQVATQAG
jgi:hypothetical protein